MRRGDQEVRYRMHSLSVQLEKAGRDLAAAQARIQAAEAAQGTAQALREAVRGALQKLTPAARCAALEHLKTAGLDLANDAQAAAPPAAPPAAQGGAFLIF